MSKATKAVVPDATKLEAMPFEEALKKLEGIVEAMESADLPLDDLLTRFEEGTRLAKACQDKLAAAELKIQKLEKNSAGEMTLKPFPVETAGEEP
jgi:exodeoxyribonuclease VII small subunit